MRAIVTVLLVIAAFLAGVAWEKHMDAPPQQATEQAAPQAQAMPPAAGGAAASGRVTESPSEDAGVAWDVPAKWTTEAPRTMRIATYDIPASDGDKEGAECAVFYFGPKQGGGVEENFSRWVGQFEKATDAARSEKNVNGMKLHLVKVSGDYLAPSGPKMQSTGIKSQYALLGAIIEGPKGSVFFKLTGPKATVAAAADDFAGLLQSLRGK